MPPTLRANAQVNLQTVRTQKSPATKNKSKISPQFEVTTFYFRQKQKKKKGKKHSAIAVCKIFTVFSRNRSQVRTQYSNNIVQNCTGITTHSKKTNVNQEFH